MRVTASLADATVLADGAAALRRAGLEAEARRAYGELVERDPNDPSVRAFLGDRLRAEGWPHDAHAAYAALEELATDEPATAHRTSGKNENPTPRPSDCPLSCFRRPVASVWGHPRPDRAAAASQKSLAL